MAELNSILETFIQQQLLETDLFLVRLAISSDQKIIRILVDGDEGINIDQCTQLSRATGGFLEENDLIQHAYTLEVSSPGVSEPLAFERQYHKHLGRTLAVVFPSNEKIKGVLKNVDETGFIIEINTKEKGKKAIVSDRKVLFNETKEVKVEVSFK
jgi:ribosome maturation factor RimP